MIAGSFRRWPCGRFWTFPCLRPWDGLSDFDRVERALCAAAGADEAPGPPGCAARTGPRGAGARRPGHGLCRASGPGRQAAARPGPAAGRRPWPAAGRGRGSGHHHRGRAAHGPAHGPGASRVQRLQRPAQPGPGRHRPHRLRPAGRRPGGSAPPGPGDHLLPAAPGGRGGRGGSRPHPGRVHLRQHGHDPSAAGPGSRAHPPGPLHAHGPVPAAACGPGSGPAPAPRGPGAPGPLRGQLRGRGHRLGPAVHGHRPVRGRAAVHRHRHQRRGGPGQPRLSSWPAPAPRARPSRAGA